MKNTLKYAKMLEEAGLPRNQAETHIQVISETLGEDVVTKQDLNALEQRLEHKIELLDSRFCSKLEKVENRVTIKLGALMTFLMIAIPSITKTIF